VNRDRSRPGCLLKLLGLLRGGAAGTGSSDEENLPYRASTSLLTPAEVSFYHVLRQALPDGLVLCPQVRLADVLFVTEMQRNFAYFSRISQKHIDLVVCDAQTLKPLVAIELDDGSHQSRKRRDRDEFVNKACAAAGLPLLRFAVQHAYQPAELRERILAHLPQPTAQAEPTPPSPRPANEPPLCPKCGRPLVVRTARRGSHAGSRFYGCPNYPSCRHTQPMAETPTEASDPA